MIRFINMIEEHPPPRWMKRSRGVRTRGLWVGIVGVPDPFLCKRDKRDVLSFLPVFISPD